MGRPLTKETLRLLRPTAVTVDGGSELPADIIEQESSTNFIVQTADGRGVCRLTSLSPEPGEMRLKAFISDNSSYYVTHISDKLVTLEQDTGTELPSGQEIPWTLYNTDPNDVKVQNKTNWVWLNVYDTFNLYDAKISNDLSMYLFGTDDSDPLRPMLIKFNNDDSVDWSVVLDGITDSTFGFTIGGVDFNNNCYLFAGDSANKILYLVKINNVGEIEWQKQLEVTDAGTNDVVTTGVIDNQNNIIIISGADDKVVFSKFSPQGDLLWQRISNHPANTGEYINYLQPVILPDNSLVTTVNQSQPDNSNRQIVLKLDESGDVLLNKSWNYDITTGLYPVCPSVDSTGNMYITSIINDNPTYRNATLQKISPNGTSIWAKIYGSNSAPWVYPEYSVTDADNNIYVAYNFWNNNNFIITKWNSDGNLLWQRLFTFSSRTVYSWNLHIVNNNLYINWYTSDNDPYINGFIRIPLDGDFIGSYTDPVSYVVTDAASSGYDVQGDAAIYSVASNLTIETSNYTNLTHSNLTLIDQSFGYTFGYK